MSSSLIGDSQVLVAIPGRHHLYHTARAYERTGRLGAFLTERYVYRPSRLRPLTRVPVHAVSWRARKMMAWHHPDIPLEKVMVSPGSPMLGVVMRGLGAPGFVARQGRFAEVAGRIAVENGWACHTPPSHGLEAFRMCREADLPCLMEMIIGHVGVGAKLLNDEFERWGMPGGNWNKAFTPQYIGVSQEELTLATVVIAGSCFVRDTLIEGGIDPGKIHVCQYGVDVSRFPERVAERRAEEPLQVAFVGEVGLRKGVLYLLEAAKELGPKAVHVNLFGSMRLPKERLDPFRDVFTYHGHVTQDVLLQQLHRCHAKCMPSLWEGSSYAIYEALATGLPAVVTPNVGSVVQDGVDGYVVPICRTAPVTEALQKLIDDEPARQGMGHEAARTARRFTWDRYVDTLIDTLGLTESAPVPAGDAAR